MTTDVTPPSSAEHTAADLPADLVEERAARRYVELPPCLRRYPELAVTVGAALLFSWNLTQNGTGNDYYAAAVRSMSRSWSNFFYASLDPGGWITVDKPPGALWLQSLAVRIFGYHSWSLLLPSVLCDVAAVWVLIAAVSRPWGRCAGLVAGAALALTPMVVATSRSNNPDMTLMFLSVLAAWATVRAIEDGRRRWMMLAGVACGFGFLTKLLAAGLVMPGLWGAYLITGPGRWKSRFVDCLLGAVAFAAVCLSWVLAVDLRPLADRPWIGGSTDGTARDLIFGYNGFGRILGASDTSGGFQVTGGSGPGQLFGAVSGVDEFGGAIGITRLFNMGMGDQVMWLFPAALAAAMVGMVRSVRDRTRDHRLGSLLIWFGWLVVVFFLFSFANGTFHNYYVSLLAPAVAALFGIGAGMLVRTGLAGWAIGAAVLAGTVALDVAFMARIDAWTWLRIAVPVIVTMGVVAGVVALVRSELPRARLSRASLWVLVVGLLAAPAAWSVAGVEHPQTGTFPDARPATRSTRSGGGLPGFGGAPGGPFGAAGGPITSAELAWLTSHRHGERWLVAMSSSMDAAGLLIRGLDVVALGGFSGGDRAATPAHVAPLVARGEIRYFSLSSGGLGGGSQGLSSAVTKVCAPVSAAEWNGTATTASGLYDCKGKATQLRTAKVPATPNAGPGNLPAGGGPGGAIPDQIRTCLEAAGVRVDPKSIPDFSNPKVATAIQTCLPNIAGGFPGGGPPPAGGVPGNGLPPAGVPGG